MAKILLDYVFPISVVEPTPQASTAFLKQACLVVKPKGGQEANVGEIYECVSNAEVLVRTDNTNAAQLFAAGMSKVYILLANNLDLSGAIDELNQEVWTLLISDDFDDDDITASAASLVKGDLTFTAVASGYSGNDISIAFITGGTAGSEVVTVVGNAISVSMEGGVSTATQLKTALDNSAAAAALITTAIASGQGAVAQAAFALDNLEGGDGLVATGFDGVIGYATDDQDFAQSFAASARRVAFFTSSANGAANMCFAFGKLLSNLAGWNNQQYIPMPLNDGVDTLGQANSLFDDRVSFVVSDTEFSNRLALFAAGGKAIIAPYVLKNLRIDLQSRAVSWIAANQPQYTLTQAALLESRLQEDVIEQRYIQPGLIEAGTVEVSLLQDNFVATGNISVSEPTALWRIFGELRADL